MADIKTRDVVKGTVKTLDRSAVATERMKSATVRTKDAAEQSVNGNEVSAQEYGANRVESAVEIATAEGVHQFNKRGKNGIRDAKRNVEDDELDAGLHIGPEQSQDRAPVTDL